MSLKSNLIKAAGLGVIVTAVSAGAAWAAVATASVNVRSGPSTSYRVVDTLFPGEVVAITGRSNGFCRVDKPGANGWVSCGYLSQTGLDRGPEYIPYPVYPAPSVSFGFGFGGFGHHYMGPPHHHYHRHHR
jgi:uncharacterized protein YraI